MALPSDLHSQAESYLQHLCYGISNRRVGSEGNREATNYFSEILAKYGFDIEYQEFDCLDWMDEGARLVSGDKAFDVLPSPYTLGIRVRAHVIPLTTFQELESAKLKGKIALLHGEIAKEQLMPKFYPFFNPDHHRTIISTLESKSPLAIISATGRDPSLAGGMYPFPLIEDGDFDIPSIYMTDEEGRRLLKVISKPVHLEIRASRRPAKGMNVIARKGIGKGRRVVVTAHIDSKDNTPAALDNAGGVVTLMLLAELFQDYDGEVDIELTVLNGEDYYSAVGEVMYLKKNQGKMDEIVLNINLDGIGFHEGGTSYSLYECSDEKKRLVQRTFSKHDGLDQGVQWYTGDHMIFIQNGVPAIAITSEEVIAGLSQFSHTANDRPDMVDISKLVTTGLALRDLVLELNEL